MKWVRPADGCGLMMVHAPWNLPVIRFWSDMSWMTPWSLRTYSERLADQIMIPKKPWEGINIYNRMANENPSIFQDNWWRIQTDTEGSLERIVDRL